jgi:hypothetical protein
MLTTWQLVLNLAGLFAAAVGGYYVVRSKLIRTQHEELLELATTRGQRIEDLESELRRVTERLSRIEGQFAALQGLKAQEIAVEVARLLSMRPEDRV